MKLWYKKIKSILDGKAKGFVILYAVLLTTVVLAIGLTVATIIAKQLQLAYIEKSYQAAYYAADAGRRCAFFWDGENGFWRFGQSSVDGLTLPANIDPPLPVVTFSDSVPVYNWNDPLNSNDNNILSSNTVTAEQIYCGGRIINLNPTRDNDTKIITRFKYDLEVSSNRKVCVDVTVTKTKQTSESDPGITATPGTVIESNGYSVECSKTTLNNPRIIQRTLRLEY